MTLRISKPGIHLNMASADYFADPCASPSLTQSLAKILLERSPLHAWHAHPRLNPDYQHDDDRKFDVGNIAHKLLIGRGKEIEVIEGFDDWRTKDAKAKREEAAAAGKLAVLGKHYAKADRMVKAAREQLESRELGWLFDQIVSYEDPVGRPSSDGEVVIAWQEGSIWLRQMIDFLSWDRSAFVDYKTTGESAAPYALARKMIADGWPIQAAMAERGLDVLDPDNAGRRRYLFVVQEDEVPYALSVVEIGEAALTIGRKQLDHAVSIWRRCVEQNIWPGYPTEINTPELPAWAEQQWLAREIENSERELRVHPPISAVDAMAAG